jgi:hypothetical protein
VKRLCSFFVVVAGIQPVVAIAPRPTQAERDYSMGSIIGECVIAKCQVLQGFIVGTPEFGGRVKIEVQEWLYGHPPTTETITLPYNDENADAKDGVYRLNQAWARIQVLRNAPITAVVATEKGPGGVSPGQPVFLTSDARETAIVRSLTQQMRDLNTAPDLVSEAVASLSHSPNPAYAGYLAQHLRWNTALKSPDLGSALGLQLLASSSVPSRSVYVDALNDILTVLVLHYTSLSQAGRSNLVQGFAELIRKFAAQRQSSDLPAAVAAFVGLTRIASSDPSVAKLGDPETRSALTSAYIAQAKKGDIGRSRFLEAELGIRPTAFAP